MGREGRWREREKTYQWDEKTKLCVKHESIKEILQKSFCPQKVLHYNAAFFSLFHTNVDNFGSLKHPSYHPKKQQTISQIHSYRAIFSLISHFIFSLSINVSFLFFSLPVWKTRQTSRCIYIEIMSQDSRVTIRIQR